MLSGEGYITGLVFPAAVGGVRSVKLYDARITQKGIEFLQENGSIQRAAKLLQTVKDTVPGL